VNAPTETDEVNAPAETDEVNGPTETEGDDLMVQDDDRAVPEESDFDLAGTAPEETAADQELVPEGDRDLPQAPELDPAGVQYEDTALDADTTLAEPGVADVPDAGSPSACADERWHEILTMFVDDPRSSVELAAGLVDDSAEALVTFVQERQHALLSSWQGDDAGTEQMRVALQEYRTFWNRIDDLSRDA